MRTDAASAEPLEAQDATERETKKPRIQNPKAKPHHSDDASPGMPMADANIAVPAQAHADTLSRQVRLARPANWDSMSKKASKIGQQNKQSTSST
jgi:hypothetical protein